MTYPTDPCSYCKEPILRAMSTRGDLLDLDPTPTLSGTYRLQEGGKGLPVARKPSAKLAFGVRLYVVHACSGRRWGKH